MDRFNRVCMFLSCAMVAKFAKEQKRRRFFDTYGVPIRVITKDGISDEQ